MCKVAVNVISEILKIKIVKKTDLKYFILKIFFSTYMYTFSYHTIININKIYIWVATINGS